MKIEVELEDLSGLLRVLKGKAAYGGLSSTYFGMYERLIGAVREAEDLLPFGVFNVEPPKGEVFPLKEGKVPTLSGQEGDPSYPQLLVHYQDSYPFSNAEKAAFNASNKAGWAHSAALKKKKL